MLRTSSLVTACRAARAWAGGLDGGRTVGTGPQHLDVIPGFHAAQAVLHAVHAAEQAPAAVLQLLIGDGAGAQVGQLLEDGLFGAGRVGVLHTAVHGHAAGKALEGGRAVVAQVVALPHIQEQAAGHRAAVQGHGKAHSGQLLGLHGLPQRKQHAQLGLHHVKGLGLVHRLLPGVAIFSTSGSGARSMAVSSASSASRMAAVWASSQPSTMSSMLAVRSISR